MKELRIIAIFICLFMCCLTCQVQAQENAIKYRFYKVAEQDSYYSISKKFGLKVNDLKAENNDVVLSVGWVLRWPILLEQPETKSQPEPAKVTVKPKLKVSAAPVAAVVAQPLRSPGQGTFAEGFMDVNDLWHRIIYH